MSLVFICLGLLSAGLAIPLVLGKIKPNPLYGFRTPRTLSSPAVWYPANRAAGWALLVGGAALSLVALALVFLGGTLVPESWVIPIEIAAVIVFLAGTVTYSFLVLRGIPPPPPGGEVVSEEQRRSWGKSLDRVGCLLFAVSGLLFVGLAIPLILEKIEPNHAYGFRTAKTLSSPEIWYAANRVAGWDLLVAGALTTLCSVLLLALGHRLARPGRVFLIALAVFVVTLALASIHGAVVVARL